MCASYSLSLWMIWPLHLNLSLPLRISSPIVPAFQACHHSHGPWIASLTSAMPTNHRGIFPDAFYQLLRCCWRTDVPGHIYQARHCLCCECSGTLQCHPGLAHWNAVKHLFHYLKGTGGCKDSGHSTGAYVVNMGTGVISWSSKLMGLVAQATTEAVYIAAVEAGKEIVWLCNLLEKMGSFVSSLSILHTDNQSVIQVTKNPEHHGCMKHLDLRWFWLRDVVDQGVISPVCPHNWDACWPLDQAAFGSSQGATVLQDAWTSPIRGELGYQRCAIMGETSCCTWATSNGRPPQALSLYHK